MKACHVTIRTQTDLYQRLQALAAAEKRTLSNYLRIIFEKLTDEELKALYERALKK